MRGLALWFVSIESDLVIHRTQNPQRLPLSGSESPDRAEIPGKVQIFHKKQHFTRKNNTSEISTVDSGTPNARIE